MLICTNNCYNVSGIYDEVKHMNENFEKMHNGELYLPNDKELAKLQMKCLDRLYDFNQTRPTEMAKRQELLKGMFAEIGDHTMIGPNVTLASAGHPVLPELREKEYQFNMPIHIGKNCWLGAGTVVVPGVSIGDNTVIGAGSIVTKDIPANVVAVGNPCRVMREIGERDKEYYYKDRKIGDAK